MSANKRRSFSTLDNYFQKISKKANEAPLESPACEAIDSATVECHATVRGVATVEQLKDKSAPGSSEGSIIFSEAVEIAPCVENAATAPLTTLLENVVECDRREPKSQNDIGLYVNCAVTDAVRERVWKETWEPPGFGYQIESQTMKDGKRRKFQLQWLQRFKWLAYSHVLKGAFCKNCVLFATKYGSGKGSHQKLQSLINTPFNRWKDAIESFVLHSNTGYHKDATLSAQNFIDICEGKQDSINLKLDTQAKAEFEKNKAKLRAIIETIILCGRQDIALRGDEDSGRLTLTEPVKNDGNFRALLRYRANGGDQMLVEHIQTAGGNALYTSPTIQNEIICIIGKQIQEEIISKVNKAKFYSVLADETADISNTVQLSICVRYVDRESMDIREDFLTFVPVNDVTGVGLASTLKSWLRNLGLDLNNMRGQGYDGAASMSGAFRGVQALILQEYPTALYTHCSSHCLNLCLSDASNVRNIRNAFSTISDICKFFRTSPKRNAILKKLLQKSSHSFTRLPKYLCETRWVERHEAVSIFCDALPQIVAAFEELMDTGNDEKGLAAGLHRRVCSFEFIISICVSEVFLGHTYHLSEYLQSVFVDLSLALEHIDLTISKLADVRRNAESEFRKIFLSSTKRAEEFGVEPQLPRLNGTLKYRNNQTANSCEDYYRCAIFIPYLEELTSSLENRFARQRNTLLGLECVLPRHAPGKEFEKIEPVLKFYISDLQQKNQCILRGEWEMWAQKWQNTDKENRPKYANEALKQCNENLFPNINVLLSILATLPVTTASAERTFSALKRLKTYLRNRTGEERLTGLALLSIYRKPVNVDEVIATFMKTPRRIQIK